MVRAWFRTPPGFNGLWAAHGISQLGTQVTVLAIPLMAALSLGAGPMQMGLLAFVQFVPYLVVGVFAGAIVDRLPRQPVMVLADIGRAALLICLPAAALTHFLSLELVYVVAALNGTLTVFFDAAAAAYLPLIASGDDLVACNSRLNATASGTAIAGSGIGGVLVQAVGPAFAVLVDAFSYLASMTFLVRLPRDQAPVSSQSTSLLSDVLEGLAVIWSHPVIRSLALCSFSANVFGDANIAVFVLFAVHQVGLTPAALGTVYAASGVGALVGALLGPLAHRRFGLGRTVVFAQTLAGVAALLVALVGGPRNAAWAELVAVFLAWDLGVGLYVVNSISLRQHVTPDRLQGRVAAGSKAITWGLSPLGFLAGGWAGSIVGLRTTLFAAGLGVLASTLWLLPLLRQGTSVPSDASTRVRREDPAPGEAET